ncbi:unnamed protein product [Thelazia callipaeda]|uniref:alpha-glucosidase n=1 Tax=Thelazia callipaeda TaxID=103827 RepID=A0A0N5CY21_THECL|nr:unnamed protein product [Thelazia callipaeda]
MALDDSKMPFPQNVQMIQIHSLEVKETNFDPEQNGTKICEPRPFIGLTKEQLEQYRNDPFWKILRYIMFALFWVAWILMFLGAILLVVFSPKCAPKKEPEWWRKQISYQIFTPSFRDSNSDGIGDFNGIREKLDDLLKIGVQTIWVTPVIATQKDDFKPSDIISLTSVDERFGTIDDLKLLIDQTHKLGMRFTMDLPISTISSSHEWFKSAKEGGKYYDYFIWKKKSEVNTGENYVVEEGNENAFLTYNGKDPVLNWHNPDVRQSIFDVAKNFLNLGVDGFYLEGIIQIVKYLPAPQMLNEFINSLQLHVNQNETIGKREIAVFSTMDDLVELPTSNSSQNSLSQLTYIIDNSVTRINNESCLEGLAHCLYVSLISSLEQFHSSQLPYAWQFTDYHNSRLSTRFNKATSTLLTFLQLSLPGIAHLYYGQELALEDADSAANKFTGLMQWDSSEYGGFTSAREKPFFSTTTNYKDDNFMAQYSVSKSPLKTMKTVAKIRQADDSFTLGKILIAPLHNDVIMFGRFHQTNDSTVGAAYSVVANFANEKRQVDASIVLPEDRKTLTASIIAVTPNVQQYRINDKLKIHDQKITLGPQQGIILKVASK